MDSEHGYICVRNKWEYFFRGHFLRACKSFILWYMYAHYRFPQLVFMFFFIFCIFVFLLSAFVFEPGSHSITDICPLLLLPPCILYLYFRFLHFKFQMQNVLSINIMFLLRRGNERQYFIPPLEMAFFLVIINVRAEEGL